MKGLIAALKANDLPIHWVVILILLPALFVNLGIMPMVSDEGFRGLVALEMDLSGNYLTPTLNGEYYYRKPPLYNWLILAFFKLFGSYSLYVFRLPSVLSLIGFCLSIYFFAREHFSQKLAIIAALCMATCGRILFNDSYLGLIDICFSWLAFQSFVFMYRLERKEQYYALFITTYALAAMCYLMKGFPAIVTQGSSLLALFLWRRKFLKLFSLPHIVGGLVMIGIIGGYYLAYSQVHEGSWKDVFATLWDQSSQRTVSRFGLADSLAHISLFPIKILYELLPLGFLVIAAIRKDFWSLIKASDFAQFCFWILVVNLPPYWLSPYWRARYIFMLLPVIFLLFVYFVQHKDAIGLKRKKIIDWTLGIIGLLAALALLATPFIQDYQGVSLIWPKVLFSGSLMALTLWLYKTLPNARLILFIGILAVGKWASDLIYLPVHSLQIKEAKHRELAIKAAQMSMGQPLHVYQRSILNEDISFYIARERKEVLKRTESLDIEGLIIIDNEHLNRLDTAAYPLTKHFEFLSRHERNKLYLVSLRDD